MEENIGHESDCAEHFSHIAFEQAQKTVTKVLTIETDLRH